MKIIFLFVLLLIALFSFPYAGRSASSQFTSADSLKIIEKVYLHSDRDTYYPGDDLWFKAYLIDASDRSLSDNSQNLHVELISPALKIFDSRVVKLKEGLAKGDFHLSQNLNTGTYRLRAYTNYMRNFGDEFFFNKDISIINPVDKAKAFPDRTGSSQNKFEINFFPEGGSLVENVPSLVAFKAIDANGMGCEVTGEIATSTGEIITSFKSTHKGMGTFPLTTVHGLKYLATARNSSGDVVKSSMPAGSATGIALNLYRNTDNELIATFKTNDKTLPLILDHDLILTVSARSIIFKSINLRLESLKSYFILPVSDLPDGIYAVSLYGPDNMALCERMVFVQNNGDTGIKVETDKTVYNKRDSVSLKISITGSQFIPQNTFLSLSAADNIFTNNTSGFPSTISSWFLLESDIRGQVEEPSYYFDPANPDRSKDLDMLLLTQGWRDFKWKYNDLRYPPESGFTISGRVRKKFIDAALTNSTVTLGIFKAGNPFIEIIPVDSTGRFHSKRVDINGEAKLVASVTSDKDNLKGWLLLDSARYMPAPVNDSIIRSYFIINDNQLTDANQLISKNLHTFIQYAEIKTSVQKKYKLSDTIALGEVNITAKRVDSTESARSRSTHYLRGIPDREVIITPQLEIYNNVYQLVSQRYYRSIENPLYMIDGVKVEEDQVKSLPLSLVERIDFVENSAALRTLIRKGGTYGFSVGAVSIILRSDFPSKPVSHSVNIKFSGYNEPRIFYSPKHHTTLESDYKPDLRTTIFWEPNIKVENNKDLYLNYYNADNPSIVKLVVEGITSTGIPVSGKTEYEVR